MSRDDYPLSHSQEHDEWNEPELEPEFDEAAALRERWQELQEIGEQARRDREERVRRYPHTASDDGDDDHTMMDCMAEQAEIEDRLAQLAEMDGD